MKHKEQSIKVAKSFWKIIDIFFLGKWVGKVYKWLTNKKKIFKPREVYLNWLIFLITLLLIIFITVFSALTYQIKIDFSNLRTAYLPYPAGQFGAGSFILMIMLVTVLPFKVYFRTKRKQASEKKDEKNEKH